MSSLASLTSILAKAPAGKTITLVWVTPDGLAVTYSLTLAQIPPQ